MASAAYNLHRALRVARELRACASFLRSKGSKFSLRTRLELLERLYVISFRVESPHNQDEIVPFIEAILSAPSHHDGAIVEAGCFKGSSTAKFSLAADLVGKELVVFDSFQGIPENDEPHDRNIFGGVVYFKKGQYRGTLEEVRNNVTRFGKIGCCRFVPGWFDDTLPAFAEPVSSIYLDVDLASSTRLCLKHLYPLLETGGVLHSQDGHLPLVIEVFDDDEFWLREVGGKKPTVRGLGSEKLLRVVKEG